MCGFYRPLVKEKKPTNTTNLFHGAINTNPMDRIMTDLPAELSFELAQDTLNL